MQYGAITSLTYHPTINWLDDFFIESGFDFEQQENKYLQFRTDNGIPRAPASFANIRNDEKWNFLIYGGYVQAVIKPAKWLKITPGYRADQVDGNFSNFRPTVSGDFPVNDYGTISQPKIGAVITPVEGYSLYGNWGRTFQIGVGSATFRNLNAANVKFDCGDAKRATRRRWLTMHLYLGLSLGALLAAVGITGGLLAFYLELDEILNPELVIADPSVPRLPYQEIFNAIRRAEPTRRFPKTNVWIDQYSGKILRVNDPTAFSAGDTLCIPCIAAKPSICRADYWCWRPV